MKLRVQYVSSSFVTQLIAMNAILLSVYIVLKVYRPRIKDAKSAKVLHFSLREFIKK